MKRPGGIRVDAVSKNYRTSSGLVRAIDGVTLEVEPGGSLAITGRSGCGKSTLLGLIGGLEAPTAGRVVVGGLDLSSMSDRQRDRVRREHVGFVFQADNLLPYLTAAENVALQVALHPSDGGERRCLELLTGLGLGDCVDKLPDQLSGGQRLRVAVARAPVHHPGVVLADEPTGAVDADNAHVIVDLLLAAQASTGATLVVVTHDDDVARRLERTLRLQDGRLVDADRKRRVGEMFAYVWRDLVRNPRRTLAALVGITLGVGLFSGVLFFSDGSRAMLTKRAIAPLALDMQAVLTAPMGRALRLDERLDAAGTLRPGGQARFTLTVVNQAAVAANEVVVADEPPPPLRYVPGSMRRNGVLVRDVDGQIRSPKGLRKRALTWARSRPGRRSSSSTWRGHRARSAWSRRCRCRAGSPVARTWCQNRPTPVSRSPCRACRSSCGGSPAWWPLTGCPSSPSGLVVARLRRDNQRSGASVRLRRSTSSTTRRSGWRPARPIRVGRAQCGGRPVARRASGQHGHADTPGDRKSSPCLSAVVDVAQAKPLFYSRTPKKLGTSCMTERRRGEPGDLPAQSRSRFQAVAAQEETWSRTFRCPRWTRSSSHPPQRHRATASSSGDHRPVGAGGRPRSDLPDRQHLQHPRSRQARYPWAQDRSSSSASRESCWRSSSPPIPATSGRAVSGGRTLSRGCAEPPRAPDAVAVAKTLTPAGVGSAIGTGLGFLLAMAVSAAPRCWTRRHAT